MTNHTTWTLAALALLGVGWLASARSYRRRIEALELQLKVTRETAAVHAQHARRQIGQLNEELALRPPRPAAPAAEADPTAPPPRRRPEGPDRFLRHEDGFPQTAIVGDGFPPTQIVHR